LTQKYNLFLNKIVKYPEHKLVLNCVRNYFDNNLKNEIQSTLNHISNWDILLEFADEKCLIPILHGELSKFHSGQIPNEFLDELNKRFRESARYNLILKSELLRIIDEFNKNGLNIIPFKGVILSELLYGDLSIRPFSDLDLFIGKEDFLKANELLLNLNYLPQFDINPISINNYFESVYFSNYTHKSSNIVIDLQWSIESMNYSFSLSLDKLINVSELSYISGKKVNTFSNEDLLILLSIHGSKHNWSRLIWICDIAKLLSSSYSFDWNKIFNKCVELKCKRMFLISILLCKSLFNINIPEIVKSEIKSDKRVHKLLEEICHSIFDNKKTKNYKYFSPYIRSMDSLKDKVNFFINLIRPTPLEYRIISLPQYMHFLYYPIRFSRLLRKYLSMLINKIRN